jgi:hypothetical protein
MLIIFAPLASVYATGIFGMGISAGVSGEGGSLGDIARDINIEMHSVGGSIEDVDVPYLPVLSIEFLYSQRSLIVGLGWEYCTTLIMAPEGSIAGNTITIDYTRFTFPLTVGMAIPLTDRTRFYFAGGFNISYIVTQVNQSSPGALASYPDDKHLFTRYVGGFHFKTGAEAVVSRNYSLFFEYKYYMRRADSVHDKSGSAELIMGGSDFEITAGLRYNLDLSF